MKLQKSTHNGVPVRLFSWLVFAPPLRYHLIPVLILIIDLMPPTAMFETDNKKAELNKTHKVIAAAIKVRGPSPFAHFPPAI
jgi:hypothetical protein